MALQKQSVPINFSKGLNTKADSKQMAMDTFLSLENSVFNIEGQLTKRNGFGLLTTIPNAEQTTLTTLNDNLLATGSHLYAYSSDNDQWLNQGVVQPVSLSTQSVLRSATSQVSPDMAVASSGLACLVYMDAGASYYQISDSTTGQQIVTRTALPTTAVNPRVVILDRYFVITYMATVTGNPHLQFITVPINTPSSPSAVQDFSTDVSALQAGYDTVVANGRFYATWAATGGDIKAAYMTTLFNVSAPAIISGHTADLMSIVADTSGSTAIIWITFWDDTSDDGFSAAFGQTLQPILTPTQVITNIELQEITSIATNGILTIVYEVDSAYSYSPNAKTDYLNKMTISQTGTIVAATTILRSVGLASKAFYNSENDTNYVLATYGESNQPTYFLIDFSGNIYARLAYSNGGGYEASQVLPNVTYMSETNEHFVPYLIKDFLATVNKGTNIATGSPVNAIYTQTGVNLAKFAINTNGQYSSEIAYALHLTGGQLWMYDGVRPVEHGFHVWPENIAATTATGSGAIAAGTYYYSFCYEWTDNQGNLHRSAPSIPVKQITTTASSTNTIKVPTLRLTYKVSPNPVRIVGYRWSVAQPVYYQFTSLTSPTINNPAVDSVTFTDTLADVSILGQTLLYTTGGVVENIAAPAAKASALFKNRLWIIDAEDPNLLWFSKQVIQNTPVEMSDLLTVYVAPTSGAQGSTGPSTALGAMDDKLIIFKRNAIYYLVGTGPDNTGANNDFSDPTYITASVGCNNPNSIVLTPSGLMFQSDKGIWMLGRDMSTNYVGSPVEVYNSQIVKSAEAIPGTNEVRFTLNNGVTLMYDYYYKQWGTFTNLTAISATLNNNLHTYLNTFGQVFQETPGLYLDGSRPVLMSFTSAWINVAGMQGYERFYEMLLLGNYYTPFTLNVAIGYDYNISATQQTTVIPDNYSPNWGGESVWGGSGPWGGPGNVFEARVFPERQKCEAFQLSIREVYDSTYGQAAGQGLTLSGMNLSVGVKKGTRTSKASQSFG